MVCIALCQVVINACFNAAYFRPGKNSVIYFGCKRSILRITQTLLALRIMTPSPNITGYIQQQTVEIVTH
jgi:hypothetical protein